MDSSSHPTFKQVLLVIFDGWGIRKEKEHNAIAEANKPFYDSLLQKYPHTQLSASGRSVGLPDGEMGNSEVGHLTIGAGKPIDTDVVRIFDAIDNHTLSTNEAIKTLFDHVKKYNATLHLMGLVSPGGVHSHMKHLFALLDTAKEAGIKKVAIHVFTDGRDTPPQSGAGYVAELEEKLESLGVGFIASVSGRYYAMDRDKRWERTKKTYDALFKGEGQEVTREKASAVIKQLYTRQIGDEFIVPFVRKDSQGNLHIIQPNDGVFFFNFRADRARQLTEKIMEVQQKDNLCFVTMTQYDDEHHPLVAFPPDKPKITLADVVADAGLPQVHIAETEKYAHITYFLNGGNETKHTNEEFVMIPSNKEVATYDLAPEMKAKEVAEKVTEYIQKRIPFIAVNFANADMVGHSGNEAATIKAIEALDNALKTVISAIEEAGGVALITADHGNAEVNVDPTTGIKHTAHTTNPVPCIVTEQGIHLTEGGGLADVAPTILNLLGLKVPNDMTGENLLQ